MGRSPKLNLPHIFTYFLFHLEFCISSDDTSTAFSLMKRHLPKNILLTILHIQVGGLHSVTRLMFCARFIQMTATASDLTQLTAVK